MVNELFRKFSHKISLVVGSPYSFIIAVSLILLWGITGPLFQFSDTWQLVINTTTTIVTFLMVFLIQNTQNRDAKAIHLKLDELIHAVHGARDLMVDLEDMPDEQLEQLKDQFAEISKKYEMAVSKRKTAGQIPAQKTGNVKSGRK